MAQGSITIDIQAQIVGYQQEIEKVKQALSKIKVGSSIGNDLKKQLAEAERQVNNLSKTLEQRVTSETQLDRLFDKFTNINLIFKNIGTGLQQVPWEEVLGGATTEIENISKQINTLTESIGISTSHVFDELKNKIPELQNVMDAIKFDPKSMRVDQFIENLDGAIDDTKNKLKELQEEQDRLNNIKITANQKVVAAEQLGTILSNEGITNTQIKTSLGANTNADINKILTENLQNNIEQFKTSLMTGLASDKRAQSPELMTALTTKLEEKFNELETTYTQEGVNKILNDINSILVSNTLNNTGFGTQIKGLTQKTTAEWRELLSIMPSEDFIAKIEEMANKLEGSTVKEKLEQWIEELSHVSSKEEFKAVFESIVSAIRLGAKEIQNAGKEAASDIAKAQEELEKLSPRLKQLETSKTAYESVKTSAKPEIEAALKEIDGFRARIEDLERKVNDIKTEQNSKESPLNKEGEDIKKNSDESLNNASAAASMYKDQLEQVRAREQMIGKIEGVVQRWFSIYAVVRMVSNAIRSMISTIQELDATITEIAIVTKMDQTDLWGQMGSYTDMAREYAASISGVYKVSQLYYQQGLQTTEVMSLTKETLKMARISGLDYAQATDYMTNAVRSFKMEMSEASTVVDVYSAIAASSATSVTELASAMSKTASSAQAVGSSFENTTAMMAVMIEATRESAENIGSAMKSIISRYGEMTSDPSALVDSEGEEMSLNRVDKALQTVGISIHNTAGEFRNFDDVIMELAEAWDTIDTNTQRYIATTMAGNRQQSRFLALVSSYDRLKELSETAADSEDAAQQQYLKTLDSVTAKTQQLQTSLQSLYTEGGLEKLYKNALDFANNIVLSFNNIAKAANTPLAAIAKFGTLFYSIANVVTTVFGLVKKIMTNQIAAITGKARKEMEAEHKGSLGTMKNQEAAFTADYNAEWDSRVAKAVSSLNAIKNAYTVFYQDMMGIGHTQTGRGTIPAALPGKTQSGYTTAMTVYQPQLSTQKKYPDSYVQGEGSVSKEFTLPFSQRFKTGIRNIPNKIKSGTEKIWSQKGITQASAITSVIANLIGSAATMKALSMSEDTQEERSGKALFTALGSTAQGVGIGASVGGVPGAIIGGVAGLISGIVQAVDIAHENIDEEISRLTKESSNSNNTYIKSKSEAKEIETTIENLEKLKEKRNDSMEDMEAYQDAMNKAAESYPSLVSYYDEEGNAVIELANAYAVLAGAREQASKDAKDAAVKSVELAETQAKQAQQKRDEKAYGFTSEAAGLDNFYDNAYIQHLNGLQQGSIELKTSELSLAGLANRLSWDVEGDLADLLQEIGSALGDSSKYGNIKDLASQLNFDEIQDETVRSGLELFQSLLAGWQSRYDKASATVDKAEANVTTQQRLGISSSISERMQSDKIAAMYANGDNVDYLSEFSSASQVINSFISDSFASLEGISYKDFINDTDIENGFTRYYTEITQQIKDFWDIQSTQTKDQFNQLVSSQGNYTEGQYISKLDEFGISDIENGFGKTLLDSFRQYAYTVENFNKAMQSNGRDQYVELQDIVTGAQEEGLELGGDEWKKVLSTVDTLITQQKGSRISENASRQILSSYMTMLSAIDGMQELQTIISSGDIFSLEGLNAIKEKLINKAKESGQTAGLKDSGVLDEIDNLKSLIYVNISTALDNLLSNYAKDFENFDKDISSVTSGMDFKAAVEMAQKLGKNLTDFNYQNGKYYYENLTELEKYYHNQQSTLETDLNNRIAQQKTLLSNPQALSSAFLNEENSLSNLITSWINGAELNAEDLESIENYAQGLGMTLQEFGQAMDLDTLADDLAKNNDEELLSNLELFKDYLPEGLDINTLAVYIKAYRDRAAEDINKSFSEWIGPYLDKQSQAIIGEAKKYYTDQQARSYLSKGNISGFLKTLNITDTNGIITAAIASGDISNLPAEIQSKLNDYTGLIYETFQSAQQSVINSMIAAVGGQGTDKISVTEKNLGVLQQLQKEHPDWLQGTITVGNQLIISAEQLASSSETFIKTIVSSYDNVNDQIKALSEFHKNQYAYTNITELQKVANQDTFSYESLLTYYAATGEDLSNIDAALVEDGLAINAAGEVYVQNWAEWLDELTMTVEEILGSSQASQAEKNNAVSLLRASQKAQTTAAEEAYKDIFNNYNKISIDQIRSLADILGKDYQIIESYFIDTGDSSYKLNLGAIQNLLAQGKDKIGTAAYNSLLETITGIQDDILSSITNASKYTYQGTNSVTDMQKFINNFNTLFPNSNLGIEDAFSYDTILNTFTLNANTMKRYVDAQKAELENLGLSGDAIDEYIKDQTATLMQQNMDIESFLKAQGDTAKSREATKLATNIQNYLDTTGNIIRDMSEEAINKRVAELQSQRHELTSQAGNKEISWEQWDSEWTKLYREEQDVIENGVGEFTTEDIISILEQGGQQAVNVLKQLKGEEVTTSELEAAFNNSSIAKLRTATDELTKGVGETVTGYTKNIMQAAEFGLAELDDGSAVITSVGDMVQAYANLYAAMQETANHTIGDLNNVYAKLLTATDQKNVDTLETLENAAGMTYEAFGEILTRYGKSFADIMNHDFIESTGFGKIRITDFSEFARYMEFDINSPDYAEAYSAWVDSMIELQNQPKDMMQKAADELKSLSEAKSGDLINLSYLDKALQGSLAHLVRGYGATLSDGILTLGENADIPGLMTAIANEAAAAGQMIPEQLAEIADAIESMLSNIVSLLGNGLSGNLSNADAQTLSSWASQHGVELNFTKTAEGLRISNEQAYQLYQEISKIDALQGQVAFQQLKENLIATKDEFKTASANIAYIKDLEDQISILRDKKASPDNEQRIAALEEELALAKQINLERSTSADDSFNFMSNDIPAAQNNPLNYYKNWSEAIKTLNTAMKTSSKDYKGKTHKGLIDYTDFYNIVTEMNNLAKISGPIILNDAYTLNGDLKSASKLIEAGAQALTTTDAGDIAVSLGDLGINFQAGAGSMSEGIQKGIETMANSQVDMLDGLIQLLETIVAMEALGDIDTDKNGIDLSDIFTIETGDNGEQSIQEFTETYKKWQDEIKKKLDKNNKEFYDEDLSNAMSSIKIGGNSLAEMVQWDYTKFDMSTAKTFSSTMAALYKAAISDNYDLDNIAESVQQELASAGVFDQPITIDIGERTLIFTSKGHASINWADEDIKKIPEQLNKSKEDLSLLYKKYLDGTEFLTSEDVITVLALKSKLKITKTSNGKITEIEVDDGNGGTKTLTAGTDEFSRTIGRMALDDAGIDATGETVEGGVVTRTVTYQLKNDVKFVTVTGDSDGIHWHSQTTGKDYPSESAMQDAEYDAYLEQFKLQDNDTQGKELTKEQWLYQNYHIAAKIKVEWANGIDPSKDPNLRDEVMKLTSDGLTGISDWLQKNPPTDNQDGTFTVPIKGEDFTFVSEGGTDLSADLYNSLMSSLGLDGTLVNSITKGITDAFSGETGQAISKTIGDGIKLALKNGESKEGTEEVDIGDLTLKPSSTELDLGDLTSTVAKAAVKIAEAFANSLSIMPEKIEQATASVRSHFETLSQNVEDAVTQIKANIRDIQEHVPITWTINTVFPNNAILQHLLSGNYAGKGSGIEFTGDSSKLEEAAGQAEKAINGVGDTASSLPPSINIIITAEDQASSVISEIASAINNLQDKTVNITVRESVNKDGSNYNGSTNDGLGSGAQEPTVATGNIGLAKAAGTLMGELGPELVVQDGRYFVAGQNGAEFVNLQDDAIVFNHLQTEQLLKKGMSSTRGRAVTNERTAVAFAQGNVNGGPAMASASAALAALKQLRSMWASLASASVQDLAGAGGGGGGGGGGDKDMAAYIKELEKWYNWLQKIAELEDKINYQEQLRSTISSSQRKNGSAYYSSLKDTLKNLQEQVKTEQSLIDAQQKYFDKRRKELNTNGPFNSLYTFDENGQLKYKKGALNKLSKLNETDKYGKPKMSSEQQYDYIVNTLGIDEQYLQTTATGEKIDTEQEGWQATAVQAFWDKMDADKEEMQSLHDSINERSEALLAAQEQQNEILQEMRDNQLAVEQNVYDAIVDSRERAIEDAEAMRDALEESTTKFIDGLSSALDKERSMYEMQESQTDLDQKRRRLAILQRTGGSNSEIASLQSDIASSERDLYFDKQQEQIDLIQEASDKQIEKLDQQIELDKELLEYQKAHGLLWSEVADIMKMDSAAITDFITSNNSEWWAKSPVQSAQDLQDAIFQTDQWVEFRDDQNSFFQNIIDTIYNTTTNAAPDNPTSTADSTTQLDNNGNGSNNTRVKYKSLNEKKHKKITQKKNKKGKWETTKEQKEDHDFDSKGKCTKCGYKKKKDNGNGTGGSGNSGNGSGSSNGAGGNGGEQAEPISTKFKYEQYSQTQHYKIPIHSDGTTGAKIAEAHSFSGTTCTKCFYSKYQEPQNRSATTVQEQFKNNDNNKQIENIKSSSLSDINLTQDEVQKLRTSTLSNGLSAVNSAMKMNLAAINSSAYTTIDREKSTQIGSISLNMDVKQIANDYDAKRAGEKAMEEMLRIARKSTTATVRR